MKMVNLVVTCICAVANNLMAVVPNESECKVVQQKLGELTSDIYKALKAGTKTYSEAADTIMEYAEGEDRPAERLVLLREAFGLYVTGKEVEGVVRIYQRAREMGGAEYAVLVAKPNRSKLSGFPSRKFPEIQMLREQISEDERILQRIKSARIRLQTKPEDQTLSERLGNEYAAAGDWELALSSYLKANDELSKVAEWELSRTKSGDYSASKVGAFWWGKSEVSANDRLLRDSMKRHASEWYKIALDDDSFKGSDRAIVEKRILDAAATVSVKAADGAICGTRISAIESTGGQWIDTGIIPDRNTRIELTDFVGLFVHDCGCSFAA